MSYNTPKDSNVTSENTNESLTKQTSSKSTAVDNDPIILESATFSTVKKLHFGKGNAKLNTKIATFSLPAGVTCPFAHLCKTWVGENGKLAEKVLADDDAKKRFRCFAANAEAMYSNYRNAVNENLDLLRPISNSAEAMASLIQAYLPKEEKIRIHVGGDFFNEEYLLAWNIIANSNPQKTFYAYTKSIPFWVKHKNEIAKNFILTASYGGLYDNLIEENDLKRVKTYFHPDDAKADGVEIDHDDSLALDPNVKRFGLLLHGQQPKNSDASKAISRLKNENVEFGYKRSAKKQNS